MLQSTCKERKSSKGEEHKCGKQLKDIKTENQCCVRLLNLASMKKCNRKKCKKSEILLRGAQLALDQKNLKITKRYTVLPRLERLARLVQGGAKVVGRCFF